MQILEKIVMIIPAGIPSIYLPAILSTTVHTLKITEITSITTPRPITICIGAVEYFHGMKKANKYSQILIG